MQKAMDGRTSGLRGGRVWGRWGFWHGKAQTGIVIGQDEHGRAF